MVKFQSNSMVVFSLQNGLLDAYGQAKEPQID